MTNQDICMSLSKNYIGKQTMAPTQLMRVKHVGNCWLIPQNKKLNHWKTYQAECLLHKYAHFKGCLRFIVISSMLCTTMTVKIVIVTKTPRHYYCYDVTHIILTLMRTYEDSISYWQCLANKTRYLCPTSSIRDVEIPRTTYKQNILNL